VAVAVDINPMVELVVVVALQTAEITKEPQQMLLLIAEGAEVALQTVVEVHLTADLA
jgi:hypothetical protein